jgi:hypothetical protein
MRLAALGRRRHTRREAIARVLVNALRLAQAAQVRPRGGGGMLAVGVLAREEEAFAYRPCELVVISTGAADGDVRVRATRVRVLAPVRDDTLAMKRAYLSTKGAAECGERLLGDPLGRVRAPRAHLMTKAIMRSTRRQLTHSATLSHTQARARSHTQPHSGETGRACHGLTAKVPDETQMSPGVP